MPNTCIALPDGCQGEFATNAEKCSRCQYHAWINSKCQVVDCNQPHTEVTTPAICNACPGRYFDTTCKTVDCTNLGSLDTQVKCESCAPWTPVFFSGSCQAVSDCSSPTNRTDCEACGKVFSGGSCSAPSCSGTFDQTKCNQCKGKHWNAGSSQCEGYRI